ncbi:MAG: DNA repair protein RecO [Bacteroidota bacterium]
MLVKTKGIVLHHIKYKESSLLATLYTEKFGRQSFIINSVRKKRSTFKFNLFRPLSLLSLEAYIKTRNNLQRIKEAKYHLLPQTIPYDMVKQSITFFLSEVLYQLLKEEAPDHNMFNFLEHAIEMLDDDIDGKANFHLIFLLKLTKHLGITLGTNYSESSPYFNLKNGRFESFQMHQPEQLNIQLSRIWSHLMVSEFDTMHLIQLNHHQRNELANQIIRYYQYHLNTLFEMKTLKVLQDMNV